jgi:ABC-type antimicrobial peptide transport system permease subunit
MATSVSQRTQEFGIRIALGASSHSVISMVLRQGLVLVAGGLVIGLAGALVLGRVLAGLLYETEPTDAATFLGVALVFAVAAALACLLPARRATGVDPILALKSD